MDKVAFVPQTITAGINSLTIPELRERIDDNERQKQEIENGIKALRDRLSALVAEETLQGRLVKAGNPETLEDLLGDPSYQEDSSYSPDFQSLERKAALESRQYLLGKAQESKGFASRKRDDLVRLKQDGPARAEELRGQIARIDASFLGFLSKKKRQQYADELAALQKSLSTVDADLRAAVAALEAEEGRVSNLDTDQRYLLTLHDGPSATLSPRKQQAVLMSYDGNPRPKVALRLPRGPEDTEFSQVLNLEFQDITEAFEFFDYIGRDVPSNSGVWNSVGENVDNEWEMQDELVPLALEIVEFNGEKRYRIPQVAWERIVNLNVV